MPSVKSAESEILLGIIRSDSMTNGNSLRTSLLLATILGLLCRTKALPFEYVDEHEDFNYDLDTAQSQAKYDARLLSQQMLSDAELQRQRLSGAQDNALDADSARAQGIGAVSDSEAASAAQEDLEPHSRAAACSTNGHTYTHGQKVPRQDACEVCLCMDGEIFCWWEKCDKTNVNRAKAAAQAMSGGSHNVGLGLGVGAGEGNGEGNSDNDGDGDYSDPYRYESTTGKSTKVHKAARKVGKRHKHHKNQKNFNDYEVYHSQRQQQQQQQQPDYKKSVIKQQLQIQQKHKSDAGGNYNIIKQHKHEQQQQHKLPQQHQHQQQQQQQQQQNVAALAVNQAAKATHYQQPASSPPPQHGHHPHQQPHSSSKILNFPENLPALLYYDYKTEEHEHHQHQHHQQHLLHEKQRLLQQQQEALARQKASESASRARAGAGAAVELGADLAADKNSDEAETDSDILPEPPTKQPKAAASASASQWPTSSSSSTAKALMTTTVRAVATVASTSATTARTTTTTTIPTTTTTTRTATGTNGMVTSTLSGPEKSGLTVGATNLQHDRSGPDNAPEPDDAFHRWLTSTELNADNTNSLDDNLEQETPASTIIDDVGTAANKSDRSSSSSSSSSKDNGNDAVFFRSSYNDYSSEFNGSVVNIDITLTAVDVHPRRQTDLIANGNRTSGVNDNGNSNRNSNSNINSSNDGTAGKTMDPQADGSMRSISSSNQDQPQQSPVVPPYTLTTIITTTPPAPGRMCNVLGKLYKIGDVLPQDTGNCLQCICTDAVTPDEMPSVTCSPHNCPPLVLPDLFDATGY
ncbi:mediator of RNA polymerase II transcription subunit 15 [Drosophila elegans]|uniref:mediator of RNA polymerase II transcription subunit 15 n=1 Tax=Drosophila elegans TaxID=30023 RepID=UPI001BC84AD0|nr:mediator of RNA polymerase II transcription subunit 15 [Drosophila elegans]XP_017125814.2 mediator of RNA polymerase II transcription subunit 15 [Drosophila elegans]XP_017125815.2 mediator of RNA polymerase II transcription subunit 15 [Drosophila elegans]